MSEDDTIDVVVCDVSFSESFLETNQLKKVHKYITEEDEQRISKFSRPTDRLNGLASCLLQRFVVANALKIPIESVVIIRPPGKKPRLSHDNSTVVIAYQSVGRKIGVDVMELILPRRHQSIGTLLSVLRRQFTPAEASWIENADEDNGLLRFFCIWTAKEAYLKAIGTGISIELNRLELVHSSGRVLSSSGFHSVQQMGFVVQSYRLKKDGIFEPYTLFHRIIGPNRAIICICSEQSSESHISELSVETITLHGLIDRIENNQSV